MANKKRTASKKSNKINNTPTKSTHRIILTCPHAKPDPKQFRAHDVIAGQVCRHITAKLESYNVPVTAFINNYYKRDKLDLNRRSARKTNFRKQIIRAISPGTTLYDIHSFANIPGDTWHGYDFILFDDSKARSQIQQLRTRLIAKGYQVGILPAEGRNDIIATAKGKGIKAFLIEFNEKHEGNEKKIADDFCECIVKTKRNTMNVKRNKQKQSPKQKYLFHGTPEPIKGDLACQSMGNILWFALSPDIAQNYIPLSGGKMMYDEFDDYRLDETARVYYEDDATHLLLQQMGYVMDLDPDPNTGIVNSWGYVSFKGKKVTTSPKNRDIKKYIEEVLGYKPEPSRTIYELKTGFEDHKQIIYPANFRHKGKLYIFTGYDKLKIADIRTPESEYQANELELFAKLYAEGYDAVLINDYAQSNIWGNTGHIALGVFCKGLSKLKLEDIIDATNYDWETYEDMKKATTPEFKNWLKKKNPRLMIPTRSDKQLKHIMDAEDSLRAAGVEFDKGYDVDEQIRDWGLDYSLQGASIENNPSINAPNLNNETTLKQYVFSLINTQYKRKNITPLTNSIFNQTWKNLKSTAEGRKWIKNIVTKTRPNPDPVTKLMNRLEKKYKGLKLFIYQKHKSNIIEVSQIVLPKQLRSKGTGTKIMTEIIDYANRNNRILALTPSKDYGGAITRLRTFYKKLGFVNNKGHNKSFRTMATMIKYPEEIRKKANPQKVKVDGKIDFKAKYTYIIAIKNEILIYNSRDGRADTPFGAPGMSMRIAEKINDMTTEEIAASKLGFSSGGSKAKLATMGIRVKSQGAHESIMTAHGHTSLYDPFVRLTIEHERKIVFRATQNKENTRTWLMQWENVMDYLIKIPQLSKYKGFNDITWALNEQYISLPKLKKQIYDANMKHIKFKEMEKKFGSEEAFRRINPQMGLEYFKDKPVKSKTKPEKSTNKKFTFMEDSPMRQARALNALDKSVNVDGKIKQFFNYVEELYAKDPDMVIEKSKMQSSKSKKGYVEKWFIGKDMAHYKAEIDYYKYLQEEGYAYSKYKEDQMKISRDEKEHGKIEWEKQKKESKIKAELGKIEYQKKKQHNIIQMLTVPKEKLLEDSLSYFRDEIEHYKKKRQTEEAREQLKFAQEQIEYRGIQFDRTYREYKNHYKIVKGKVIPLFIFKIGDKVIIDGEHRSSIINIKENTLGDQVYQVKEVDGLANPYLGYLSVMPLNDAEISEKKVWKFGNPKLRANSKTINTNSLGKPIAKTKQGFKNFLKWFGKSKAVDDQGQPLVVYHGTKSNFNIFKPSKKQGHQKESDQFEGIYFTDSFDGAAFYSLKSDDDRFMKKVYLSIKKPYEVDNYKELKHTFKIKSYNEIGKIIKKKGYDGIFIKKGFYSGGGPYKLFLAFHPNQIKSTRGLT